MRKGVRIAVDVGRVRVGVAACDPDGVLAFPVTVLARDPKGNADLAEIAAIAAEREAIEVIVGWPKSLKGSDGAAAEAATSYATGLKSLVGALPVRQVDERLSTVEAQRRLHDSGKSVKKSRSVIDAGAAVVILEAALDWERSTGREPGVAIAAMAR